MYNLFMPAPRGGLEVVAWHVALTLLFSFWVAKHPKKQLESYLEERKPGRIGVAQTSVTPQESCTVHEINAQCVAIFYPSSHLLEDFSCCCCGSWRNMAAARALVLLVNRSEGPGAGGHWASQGCPKSSRVCKGTPRGAVSLTALPKVGCLFLQWSCAKRDFVPSTANVLMIVDFCSIRRTKRCLKGLLKELIAPARLVIVSEWLEPYKQKGTYIYIYKIYAHLCTAVLGCCDAICTGTSQMSGWIKAEDELFSSHMAAKLVSFVGKA